MLDKLQAIEDRYVNLEKLISDPAAMADMAEWQKNTKAHSKLTGLVDTFREYKKVRQGMDDAQEMLKDKLDDDFKAMVEAELAELREQRIKLEGELKIMLLPRDPSDDKNVIIEIRGGAGGDEAALFAGDLFRMYTRYAENRGWKTEVLDASPTDLGGFKEAVFVIEGDGAYSRLKYESGVHRVQRVPATEASGRIHTSTVTVAVLAEAEEVDIDINPGDLRIDTYCASGAGGQHVNKTESAVRITHLPSGLVVQCQDEKSQLKNRAAAMRVLRAKLLEAAQESQHAEEAKTRKSQVGTGDRSERIRTYNFPQGRVSDHRIGLTLHRLEYILNGDLDELLDALSTAAESDRLKQVD
ncbi:MAG: peptide chain release factor 1 [Negativicutes bacterium]|nr:peptide chain release factor 1 [Negativicutes bacterium]